MRNTTKNKIIKIIKKNGSARPGELSGMLNISLQALHKHLKQFVEQGILETIGGPPTTRYRISGIPDFGPGFKWFHSGRVLEEKDEICETRDVFFARLNRIALMEEQGIPKNELPLIISIIGEIGNNCFDHNLGQWHDSPGCWFEIQVTRLRLWILIADRGQGIFRSLSGVAQLKNDQDAMEKAFKEHISGRMPEKRGNGLKFVTNIIETKSPSGLACGSGKGRIQIGEWGDKCLEVFRNLSASNIGTITVIAWGLK